MGLPESTITTPHDPKALIRQAYAVASETYRGDAYRLGTATSSDGIRWVRSPESGLDVSRDGWDSEMIGYPSAFAHGGRRYLLYNGNRYGQTGFGLAIEE